MAKPLITMVFPKPIKQELIQEMRRHLMEFGDRYGYATLITDGGAEVKVQQDLAPALEALVESSNRTNELLESLISAMAETDDHEDEDQPMRTYLDGTPCLS